MFEATDRVAALEARKQLLLAESALNRALLAGHVAGLRDSISACAAGMNPLYRVLVSSTALIAAGLEVLQPPALRRARRPQILQVVALAASVWLAVRDIRHRGGR